MWKIAFVLWLCAIPFASAAAVSADEPRSKLDSSPGAVVAAPDRSSADRALDPQRRPAELLAFAGIRPGMRVGELGAASGYTTELLARAVGPSGAVYAQNSAFILERFAEKPWGERLMKPAMKNVVRLDRAFDEPFPGDLRDLDVVINVLFYHDTVWMDVDRKRMNAAIHAALRPGGKYVVIDHSAAPGRGLEDVQTLHRIEEKDLRAEIESAGFRLAAESDFSRNPADTRDWNAAPNAAGDKRGMSDRFALEFVRD
jgi:predicted methyltransferase